MSETLGKTPARLKKHNADLENTPLEPTSEIKKLWSVVHTGMRKEILIQKKSKTIKKASQTHCEARKIVIFHMVNEDS